MELFWWRRDSQTPNRNQRLFVNVITKLRPNQASHSTQNKKKWDSDSVADSTAAERAQMRHGRHGRLLIKKVICLYAVEVSIDV